MVQPYNIIYKHYTSIKIAKTMLFSTKMLVFRFITIQKQPAPKLYVTMRVVFIIQFFFLTTNHIYNCHPNIFLLFCKTMFFIHITSFCIIIFNIDDDFVIDVFARIVSTFSNKNFLNIYTLQILISDTNIIVFITLYNIVPGRATIHCIFCPSSATVRVYLLQQASHYQTQQFCHRKYNLKVCEKCKLQFCFL